MLEILKSRNRVVVLARQATQPGGIGSLESILGLLKRSKIQALLNIVYNWSQQERNRPGGGVKGTVPYSHT